MSEAALIEEWRRIHDAQKSLFGWPDWQRIVPRRTKGGVERASMEAARQRLIVTLADENGTALEAVQIRITSGLSFHCEVNVTFEIEHREEWICISRIDLWPSSPHTNKHWRRLGEAPEVNGCHHHTFYQNARLGRQNFKPYSNLDSATKIEPEPGSIRDMYAYIERAWRIDGATHLPPPELQDVLL